MATTVRVYRNLNRGCYSIQERTPGGGWRVTRWADTVALANATFHVSASGRRRVLDQRRKNVHATIRGTLLDGGDGAAPGRLASATYNPYVAGHFYLLDNPGAALECSPYALLTPAGLFVAAG